ncbi:tripartite tricarboxylate transporter permease [uncultured Propionivibrio sp.]|uniref:tripartite tricarboxylate transporter permease n=1 Tax=uncultured Propionivibrio sp. TaxID=426737 RepID=UPI0029C0C4F7|nr:tripartite tricarboxylate transporter permease [uncultured Propionivibrio sp.]
MEFNWELMFTSYAAVFTPSILFMIVVGTIAGIVIGALPGLTATMGVALLVPLTFGRPPLESLSMLMGIYCGAMYGGAISAILIRTPGTPAAAATVLEGYPMAKRGEAGRAMAMALFASFFGGVVGALIMTFASPFVSSVALEFGPIEYFGLAIFGLSVIISISGRSLIKGMMSAFFGLLICTTGFDPISGYPRYTFGIVEMMEGPPFIPTLIGLFAVSEVFNEVQKIGGAQQIMAKLDQYLPSWSDIKYCFKELCRSSIIGTIIGAIPGAGGDIAAFISYGEAKRASKNPERYGHGEIEGLAASECANNSCSGGAMIPLLSLGVPGDAVTAVLLGAFVIQGLQPGPMLYKEHIDLVYQIFASMMLAQFAMQFIGMAGIQLFARVIMVDRAILTPAIFVLSCVGAFAMRANVFDVYCTLFFGILGYIMMRYDYPLSPILLALILGPMAESNLRRALVISSGDFGILFSRPIAVSLMILAVISLIMAIRGHQKVEAKLAEQEKLFNEVTRD